MASGSEREKYLEQEVYSGAMSLADQNYQNMSYVQALVQQTSQFPDEGKRLRHLWSVMLKALKESDCVVEEIETDLVGLS